MHFQLKMVNRLSSRTRQMVLGEHTERTGQFVRACGAFAFITIPGITCPLVRFDLYLLSGQIALANGCLGQADACLEAAINLIPELAPSDGETSWVAGSLSNLLSTLLVQPVRTPLGLINLRSMLTVSLKSVRSSCYTFQQILSFFSNFTSKVWILGKLGQVSRTFQGSQKDLWHSSTAGRKRAHWNVTDIPDRF